MERQNLLMRSLLSPTASERRPSRRFTSLVYRMKRKDKALKEIQNQENSEKAILHQIMHEGGQLSERTKNRIRVSQNIKDIIDFSTGQSTKNGLNSHVKVQTNKIKNNPAPALVSESCKLQKPRKKSFEMEPQINYQAVKLPLTPGNNAHQLKKLAFFKKDRCIQQLDKIITEALQDLEQPQQNKLKKQIKILSPKKSSTSIREKQAHQREEYMGKLLVVLFCLITLLIFISRV